MNRKEFLNKMEDHAVIFGIEFEHYKGGRYIGICEAQDESTGETVVIYQAKETGTIWSRPLTDFYCKVEVPAPNGYGYVDRFKPVSHTR